MTADCIIRHHTKITINNLRVNFEAQHRLVKCTLYCEPCGKFPIKAMSGRLFVELEMEKKSLSENAAKSFYLTQKRPTSN